MLGILRANPLLLLFAVAAIGYPLGRLRIGTSSLGIAAVLFVPLRGHPRFTALLQRMHLA